MKSITTIVKLLLFVEGCATPLLEFVIERTSRRKGHFLRGILTGLCIGFIVTVLARLGHFKSYENPVTDFLQSIVFKKAKDVSLVFITEHEYKHGFNATSPLSRERLAKTIDLLVKLKARVIALDLDLTDATADDHKLLDAINRASASGIPVVAACKLVNEHKELTDDINLQPYQEENLRFTSDGFSLFDSISPGNQWAGKVMYGGVFFRLDKDGVFRYAEAMYMITQNEPEHKLSCSPAPSAPLIIAAAYKGMSQKTLAKILSSSHNHYNIIITNDGDHEENAMHIHIDKHGRMTPNFIGNYKHFDYEANLTRLLEEYCNETSEITTIFKDKAVIVGGAYDKNDFYMTPLGRMSGMEILANITQNIISGNLIKHTSFWIALVIEVSLGALASLVFVLMNRFRASVICFVLLVMPMTGVSIYFFYVSYHWVDFIATIFGVIFHGWVRDIEEDINTLKQSLKNIRRKFTKKKKTQN